MRTSFLENKQKVRISANWDRDWDSDAVKHKNRRATRDKKSMDVDKTSLLNDGIAKDICEFWRKYGKEEGGVVDE